MKKLINRPKAVVEEMIEGLAAAYPGLRRLPDHTVLLRSDLAAVSARPVAVLSGGGSGHAQGERGAAVEVRVAAHDQGGGAAEPLR